MNKTSPSLDNMKFIIRNSTFDQFYVNDEFKPDYRLRCALIAAEDKVQANTYLIDIFKELLCCLCGQSYKDSWNIDHWKFIKDMHKVLES